MSLPLRRLGRTNLHVSVVSLGGVGLGGKAAGDLYGGIDDDAAIAAVHRAIERGINFIDTSPLYAESERRIGLALEALPTEARSGLLVGSKVGDECPPFSNNGGHSAFSYDGVKSSVAHSLAQLRVVDKLDTVLVHDPTLDELTEFFAPETGGMAALKDLQRQEVVGSVGIGCVEHAQHRAFMAAAGDDAGVLLSVNDFNLVRRYGAAAEAGEAGEAGDSAGGAESGGGGSWVDAGRRDVGILNAGAFYMGLLAEPHTSWSQGFKASLDQPELVGLAQRMSTWSENKGIPLRTLAVQYAFSDPRVASIPIGCRSAEEVDQVVDSALATVGEEVWKEFHATFDGEVEALGKDAHWYYDKNESDIGND